MKPINVDSAENMSFAYTLLLEILNNRNRGLRLWINRLACPKSVHRSGPLRPR